MYTCMYVCISLSLSIYIYIYKHLYIVIHTIILYVIRVEPWKATVTVSAPAKTAVGILCCHHLV